MKNYSNNLVYISFGVIPSVAIFYGFLLSVDFTDRIMEAFFLLYGIYGLTIIFTSDKIYRKNILAINIFILLLASILLTRFSILEISGESTHLEFYFYPFFMEIKPLAFLALASIVLIACGPPDLAAYRRGAAVLAALMIIDAIMRTAINGQISRPIVLSESNYDGFLVILGLIAIFAAPPERGFRLYYLLFAAATLASQSKTGIAAFLVISLIHFLRRPTFGTLFGMAILSIIATAVVIERLSALDDLSDIDRIVMWISYFDLVRTMSLDHFLFGYFPGVPIAQSNKLLSWFVTHQGERLGIEGLHAFNYHSFYLRTLLTWGALPVSAMLVLFIRKLTGSRPLFYYLILILIQSFSMGVFYLSTVSVPAILLYYSLEKRRSTMSQPESTEWGTAEPMPA